MTTKTAPDPDDSAPVALREAPPPMLLNDFCRALSTTDDRAELIAAFHSDAKRRGRVTDTQAGFAQAFAAFCAAPVTE